MQPGANRVGEVNAVTITRDMFGVYGQNAAAVVGTSALIQGVALIVSFLAFNTMGIAGVLVWFVASVIAYQLSIGVFTKLLLHLRHGHAVPSATYLIKEASGHLVPLLWLATLVGVGTFVGFLFLIIPGIYLTLRWAVAAPALVARKVPAVEALRISAELTQGHKGTVWALAVIAGFFTNGVPRIIESTNPTMAMENVFILNAVIAALATPIVALGTAELFLRLSRVPDRIVPGVPLGGPAPAPAGPYVPTAAIPVQQAPGPYVPQPAPAAGFAPVHAAAPPQYVPGGYAPQPAHASYAAAPQAIPPQPYSPPAPPQPYAPPMPQHAAQPYAPPAAPQPYAPPMPQHAAQPYTPPAAPQPYAPPMPQHAAQPYAPPAAPHHYVPPGPPAAYATPGPPSAAPQAYVPPTPGATGPPMRQGPSVAPPGLG